MYGLRFLPATAYFSIRHVLVPNAAAAARWSVHAAQQALLQLYKGCSRVYVFM